MRTRRPSLITLPGLLSTLVSTLAIPALVLAQSPSGESIGIVIAVRGQVEALDASGAVRQLTRGADVFAADTIAVGPEGYAQVRMVDEALISLKSDTSFTISSYEFDGNPATPDSATMSMVRGGFRTISGSIGDADEDTYRIDTPHASIGIRGTMHSAIIVEGVLYTGVYDGGTTISNNLGSIDAGIGADFDYTETIGNEAPRGLIESPAVLGLVSLTPLLAQDAAGTAPADGSNADGADTNSPNTNAAPAALAALANGDASPGGNAAQNASPIVAANTPPATALIESNATITGGDPQDDLNPLRFSRGAAELDQSASDDGDAGGNNNGNAGNGNAGGNNNGNAGNGNAGGNNGNSGNGNAGGNKGNSGNGNAGGNKGNSGKGKAGGNSGNS
ncbi:MAG TPA: FecR family protein, partial [Pseudomonadales bacterium]